MIDYANKNKIKRYTEIIKITIMVLNIKLVLIEQIYIFNRSSISVNIRTRAKTVHNKDYIGR